MLKYWKWLPALAFFFALRLASGLWFAPVQPMEDEVQTTLVGLKYYATGDWPYYGNDIVSAPGVVSHLVAQDPGPLQAFLVGGPLKIWPDPLAPFLCVNLFSMAGFCLLAFYACKRLPGLPNWFVFPWILTAPWCLHYSTGMMNFSFTIAFACLFFTAFLESLPPLSLGWIPAPWANALMGLSLSAWIQLHRTWVLVLPLLLFSFFLQWSPTDKARSAFWARLRQGFGGHPSTKLPESAVAFPLSPRAKPAAAGEGGWKSTRRYQAPLFFILGGLPLFALVVPTFLRPDYAFSRDVHSFSFGMNLQTLEGFFTVLVQFFAMACFEMPRFIGQHTAQRFHFLASHWLLVPGVFLWYFGFLQVLVLVYFLFRTQTGRLDWNPVRFLACFLFLFTYLCLLFTSKTPDINTFCELLPMIMLYSLYVWDYWRKFRWGRAVLGFTLACALIFQPALVWIRLPEKESFYLKYKDAMAQAIAQRNYHLLGERRPGAYY